MRTKILAGVLLATLAIGCSKPNPMVGNWKMQLSADALKGMPAGMTAPTGTANFTADGKFTVNMDVMGMKQTMDGTYELKDKALTMTPKNSNGKPSTDKPETVTLADDMKSFDLPGSNGMGKMVKE